MLIADLTILRRAVPTAGRTRRSLLVIRAAKRPPPLHASGLLRQPAVGKLADANIDAISDERRWKRKGAHYGQFLAPSRGSLPTLPVAICRAPVRRGPKIVVCPLLHVWPLSDQVNRALPHHGHQFPLRQGTTRHLPFHANLKLRACTHQSIDQGRFQFF